ncbi:hypothetical protein IIS_04959 [Bacillus cereus VD131]|nr:hypothetical protein IIS_04959 [Bacillus cereus VD131]MCS3599609.1 hypothetical protein [Bacillus sp. JUb91]
MYIKIYTNSEIKIANESKVYYFYKITIEFLVFKNNHEVMIMKEIHNQIIWSLILRFENSHIIMIKGENTYYGFLYYW